MSIDQLPEAGLSTAPTPVATPARGATRRATVRRLWRQLTSMRTALQLLFLLALASVPGSLLPQRNLNPSRVVGYLDAHQTLGPILDRLGFFAVFASPWYSAIYLLLFVSLVGCLVPRIRMHAKALRMPPPATPRHLSRMRHTHRVTVDGSVEEVLAAAQARLKGGRWRVRRIERDSAGAVSLAAERGHLRETGNLVFHVSLVLLLVAVALGGLYGYKGTALVVEGAGFANQRASYDTFTPGRVAGQDTLAPFSFTLDTFDAQFQPNGQAKSFDAAVTVLDHPDSAPRKVDVRVNHPLQTAGAKVYLIGHGYAPVFTVRDQTGALVQQGPVPFLPLDGTFASRGVVKVPDTTRSPDGVATQLGFQGVFLPTAASVPGGGVFSSFPQPLSPAVQLLAFRGNLGLDSGRPQSVYELNTNGMAPVAGEAGLASDPAKAAALSTRTLRIGETWDLPGGGSIAFTGYQRWATFQVTRDPGKVLALVAAIGMVGGLLLSLSVRRRRVWVRAVAAPDDADPDAAREVAAQDATVPTSGGPPRRTVLEVAGLARSDGDDITDDLAELVRDLGGDVPAAART